MSKPKTYICSNCNKEHETWPALAYDSPTAYDILPDKLKAEIATLDSDFCIINHSEQTDRFIRVVLWQKVNDHCEDLQYGLWVSLSEKSFADYSENYTNENHVTTYFGWLSNDLPDYEFYKSIPTTVSTQEGNQRPIIVPHMAFDHPFVKDYYNGITKKEAEKRIEDLIKAVGRRKRKNKSWWPFKKTM